MNFEEKLKELEEIVNKLEDGTQSLDDTIALFEKGIKISKECQEILDNAEKKVSVLMSDETGKMEKEKFPDLEE